MANDTGFIVNEQVLKIFENNERVKEGEREKEIRWFIVLKRK